MCFGFRRGNLGYTARAFEPAATYGAGATESLLSKLPATLHLPSIPTVVTADTVEGCR